MSHIAGRGTQRAPSITQDPIAALRHHHMLASAILGGAALLAGWLASRVSGAETLQNVLLTISFGLCGVYAVADAWRSLRQLRFDIHVIMVVGAVLAAAIGHPFEGALLLFLFVLAGALENLATRRAEAAIQEVGDQFPDSAVVERDGKRETVALHDIGVGERLIVRPGDRVACDGNVVAGESMVNEAAITGEFMPQHKSIGDQLFAGSLNGERMLEVEVTAAADTSTLARVVEMVEKARLQKTQVESLIDRIGVWYGPMLVLLSCIMLLIGRFTWGHEWSAAAYRAIAVLIVGSPCALMLAAPVPILAAISRAARMGIVARGGIHFERLATAQSVFVDKTGTLTTGKVKLVELQATGESDEALAVAAALERDSTHPLANAIRTAAETRGVTPPEIEDINVVSGYGIEVHHGDGVYRLGRPEWVVEKLEADIAQQVKAWLDACESLGHTPVVMSFDGKAAVMSFADTIRPELEGWSKRLHDNGVRRIVMLTGDRRAVAEDVAKQLDIDEVNAELLPGDKLKHIAAAADRGEGVVMIGDGINDAPALARADVGIAMGGIGSDTALQAADFVLLHDRPDELPQLFSLARITRRIMFQNIAFSLGVILILVMWEGFSVQPALSLGVVGHEGSTLLVAVNGLRVLRCRV